MPLLTSRTCVVSLPIQSLSLVRSRAAFGRARVTSPYHAKIMTLNICDQA
jgi:hypothetical protein